MRSWLGDTPGFNGDVNAALRSIKAKALFIGSPQDQFYLPHHIETQVKAIPNARALWIDSSAGHLICCNADPNATRRMGDAIRAFLGELSAREKRLRSESDMRCRSIVRPQSQDLSGAHRRYGSNGSPGTARATPRRRSPHLRFGSSDCFTSPLSAMPHSTWQRSFFTSKGSRKSSTSPLGRATFRLLLPNPRRTCRCGMPWSSFHTWMRTSRWSCSLAFTQVASKCSPTNACSSVRDLKGKTVAIMYLGGGDHILLSSMLAYVGIDPREVNWMPGTTSLLDAMDAFCPRQG